MVCLGLKWRKRSIKKAMAHSARPLRITVVSPDTSVLRELCWLLTAIGYEVVTSNDTGENAAWRQWNKTDFLFFDGRGIARPISATLAVHSDNPIYRLFLYDSSASVDFTAWLAAGANDGLRVPISRGELLIRTRAGARTLEFENRIRSQSSRCTLTGLYSVRGLLHKLNKLSNDRESSSQASALLTIAIDLFTGYCQAEGTSAAQNVLTSLANTILQCAPANAIVAYARQGIFHVVLPEQNVDDARLVAEQISQTFGETQVNGDEHSPRPSVTTAIVPWRNGVSPSQLLEQAAETLLIGKQSGGDCVVEPNSFAQELLSWQTELTAGSPFANANAQDIMEPFPAVLEREKIDVAMLVALHRSRAPVWPFVDHEGHLVGAVLVADCGSPETWSPKSISSQLITNPPTIAYDALFSEIYEAFSTQACLEMVVVADRRPIGYITCDGFTSLLKRVDSATYSPTSDTLENSQSLLVGAVVNELEE
jgi:GGDEF domain-containing protein